MKTILVDAVDCFVIEDGDSFEHNPEAVKSSQSVGIKSYHYNNDKRDLKALKDFLTQNL